jgi:hypothetical protein
MAQAQVTDQKVRRVPVGSRVPSSVHIVLGFANTFLPYQDV